MEAFLKANSAQVRPRGVMSWLNAIDNSRWKRDPMWEVPTRSGAVTLHYIHPALKPFSRKKAGREIGIHRLVGGLKQR